MKVFLLPALLLLGALSTARADEESCENRCNENFKYDRICQCHIICRYFDNCCYNFLTVCPKLEDNEHTNWFPEDSFNEFISTDSNELYTEANDPVNGFHGMAVTETVPTTGPPELVTTTPEPRTEEQVEGEEELCSGKAFDAFTTIKNGSVYAFRGKYFYELDKNSALYGFPRLIKDVWGIEGPIDAAFTRINCQGKTFLFKGDKYWRFTDGELDEGYPFEISDGFETFSDNIDAAFALPAKNYKGKERVYFFKGNKYWIYEFMNQPKQADCKGSRSSKAFKTFAGLWLENFEKFIDGLYGIGEKSIDKGPHYISRDWKGVPNKVDAVLLSRIYVPEHIKSPLHHNKRGKSRCRYHRRRKPSKNETVTELTLNDDKDDDKESDPDWLPWPSKPRCKPVQSVYFFRKDKYYRVNLANKKVDKVYPRYPRSIAEYWLGCNVTSEVKN